MRHSIDAARLRAIPVFAGLDDEQLRRVATFAVERSVAAGDVLVREGDFAYDFMVVLEGTAAVLRGGRRVGTVGAGDVFGEMGVLDHVQRTATVVADDPMVVIALSRWDLRRADGLLDELRAAAHARRRRDTELLT